jgi:hypothetical protein
MSLGTQAVVAGNGPGGRCALQVTVRGHRRPMVVVGPFVSALA